MEENEGILKKIQKIFSKLFKKSEYKELPTVTEKETDIQNNEEIDNNEKTTFKEKISNLSEISIEQVSTEEKNIIDSIENFSFPANLEGYKFISGAVIDENSPIGSYVCYMIKSDKTNLEDGLPICSIRNKEKLRIVEDYLNKLKEEKGEYNQNSIKDIIKQGFELNGEKFYVSEDYHLKTLLEAIVKVQDKEENITIPMNYICEIVKGYKIEKTSRLKEIEKEEMKKQKEEEKKKKYYDTIKNSIIKDELIDTKNMNSREIKELKEYYKTLINKIEKEIESDEYSNLGVEYITKLTKENDEEQRYSKILKLYNEINNEEQSKKYTGIREMKISLSVQKGKTNRVIKNILLSKLKQNFNILENQEQSRDR